MKILFLDIDGVLNKHDWNKEANSCGINLDCIRELNRVILETNCKIVLSSAWRYMIHGGAMTTKGFEYLLRTHGAIDIINIIDITIKDEDTIGFNTKKWCRGEQIKHWLSKHKDITSYAIIDDDDFDEIPCHRFVKTIGSCGILPADADKLISILNKP